MIVAGQFQTRVLIGAGAFEDALRTAAGAGPTVAVVDAGADAASGGQLARTVAAASAARATVVVEPVAGRAQVAALARTLDGARCVLAVGGGSVLDLAKLACVASGGGPAGDALRGSGRSGLVVLPPATVPQRRVLVPTTIGTGAEVSAVACLVDGEAKRLVLGEPLRSDCAVLDPALTRSAPRRLLAEGVLEALLRVAGPYAATPPRREPLSVPDSLALWLMRELTGVGERVTRGEGAGEPGDGLRVTAAQLSAYTHAGWALAGRAPFGWKLWYLANELSAAYGIRKMEAIACLLPHYWRRIAAGDVRFGSRPRLLAAWDAISGALAGPVSRHPAEGVRELLARWAVGAAPASDDDAVDALAARAHRAWGGGLPMLAPLRRADVRELYRDALAGAGAVAR